MTRHLPGFHWARTCPNSMPDLLSTLTPDVGSSARPESAPAPRPFTGGSSPKADGLHPY